MSDIPLQNKSVDPEQIAEPLDPDLCMPNEKTIVEYILGSFKLEQLRRIVAALQLQKSRTGGHTAYLEPIFHNSRILS